MFGANLVLESAVISALQDETLVKDRNSNVEGKSSMLTTGCIFETLDPMLQEQLKNQLSITKPTTIQNQVLPEALKENHSDLLVCSLTGSGKTICYLLPIINKLTQMTPRISRGDGIRAIILAPTRELCLQIQQVFSKLTSLKYPWLLAGVVMGGERRKMEKAMIRKGVSVLIGTPGRILDHLEHTTAMNCRELQFLMLDEADRLLDLGFQPLLLQVLSLLKARAPPKFEVDYRTKKRPLQMMMVSATLTPSIESLASEFLESPLFIQNTHMSGTQFVVPEGMSQGFVRVDHKRRFFALYAFLSWKQKAHSDLKAIIFMSTCAEVEFYTNILSLWFEDSWKKQLYKLHGSLDQVERSQTFLRFSSGKAGIMLCTNVAARGLDLPEVDWIVQYDPPEDVAEYVHRIGRTARLGRNGRSLLFLEPNHEAEFIEYLKSKAEITDIKELDLDTLLQSAQGSQDSDVNWSRFINDVESDGTLLQQARGAYLAFVRSYATYSRDLKHIFHVKNLHLGHLARSFGLRDPPKSFLTAIQNSKRRDREPPSRPGRSNRPEGDRPTKQHRMAKAVTRNPVKRAFSEFAA